MKRRVEEIESVFKDLRKDGLKPDQHIFLAENYNQALDYAKDVDALEGNPWRLEALKEWVSAPKKLKIIKILKKQSRDAYEKAKESSPQALEIVATLSTHDGVMGLNCFDEIAAKWLHGPGAVIIDRFIEGREFDAKDSSLFKKAEKTLERDQLSPGRGKARYLADGKILFDRPIAGRSNYVAKGVAEKIKPHHGNINLHYKIKKTETGYEVHSYSMSIMDVVEVVSINAAIGAAATFIALQSVSYIKGASEAIENKDRAVAGELVELPSEERPHILAALRDYSFALDQVGGVPGRETTSNPIDATSRTLLNEALSESILANFSVSGSDVNFNQKDSKKNAKALQALISLTDRIKDAIEKSSMSSQQKDDAIKSFMAGEKRAKIAYEMITSKIHKTASVE